MLQILKLDHLEYLVSFIRMKLDKFDCRIKEQDTEEPGVQKQTCGSSSAAMSKGPPACFSLGSPEKEEKLLLKLTGITKFSVPNLQRMLEEFVNKFRTEEEGFYRVRKKHTVSTSTYLLPPKDQHADVW